jgi:hypothetical protein
MHWLSTCRHVDVYHTCKSSVQQSSQRHGVINIEEGNHGDAHQLTTMNGQHWWFCMAGPGREESSNWDFVRAFVRLPSISGSTAAGNSGSRVQTTYRSMAPIGLRQDGHRMNFNRMGSPSAESLPSRKRQLHKTTSRWAPHRNRPG